MRLHIQGLAAACAAFLLAVPACLGAPPAPSAKTITIGVDLPLTGDEGRAGVSTLNGIRYFVQQHPTLDGFNIILDARDDAGSTPRDTSRGVKNLNAFIADSRVVAMLGPFDSHVARAQIPIANQAYMAMVSPATSSRCLTKEPFQPTSLNPLRTPVSCKDAGLPTPGELRPTGINNYFRLSATDELQGPAAADYARKQLHLMRVAVVSHHEAYGQLLANSFTARFNKLGGTVVARQEVDPAATSVDLTSFLERAKRSGAQGVYFGGAASNRGCDVRHQMATVFEIGAGTPFLGGDGIALDPTCVRDAGANAPGIYATVPAPDPEQIDSAQRVIKAFRTQYGRPSDFGPYTIAAYDATGVLYDALDLAIKEDKGTPFRATVIKQLAATTSYRGATGWFGFDKDGDTTSRLVSIFKPAGTDPRSGWKWVDTISYTAALPY